MVVEQDLIDEFVADIDTYPFKTHVNTEVCVAGGRADITLPDYDVVIEAKGSNGDVKSAMGQAIWYSDLLDMTPYLLLPLDKITRQLCDICKSNSIGVVTTHKRSGNFSIVHNVGGFEAFNPANWDVDKPSINEWDNSDWVGRVVGGVDD